MNFKALDQGGKELGTWTVFSVGGGALADENGKPVGVEDGEGEEIYEMSTMTELLAWCEEKGKSYWEYVQECEEADTWDYLEEVWLTMKAAGEKGSKKRAHCPAPLTCEKSGFILRSRQRLYADSALTRPGLFLCTGGQRRERFGRQNRHGTYLRLMWCGAGSSLPSPDFTRVQ